ncbi:MAG TPA: recombinase family protein [Labilithrix sp.]|nr:recombinase family protein [Labilithrix sp.]
MLEPDEREAEVVREIFRLYVTRGGAKAVARTLNQRGLRYRTGVAWDKGLVLDVLDEDAAVGTYYWGRRRGGVVRPRKEWLSIPVTPIVDADVHALALRLRRERDLGSASGRAVAQPRVLGGLVVCGRCRASCQLETSGKTIDGNRYRYCYYSCRTYCRAGKEECPGVRAATVVLDAAVLGYLADVVCAPAPRRCARTDRDASRGRGWRSRRDMARARHRRPRRRTRLCDAPHRPRRASRRPRDRRLEDR